MINLLSNKYNVEKPALKDELDGIDPKRLGCLEYSLNKLKADRYSIFICLYTFLKINTYIFTQ